LNAIIGTSYYCVILKMVILDDAIKTIQFFFFLRGNFSGLVCSTDPVKVSQDAENLLVVLKKKFFAWGICE